MVTILVRSKEGVLNWLQKLFFIGMRLVWPILLGFGVADVAPLLAPVCGLGQSPWLIVIPLGNPMGPASTTLEHFMVELEDLLVSPAFPDESSLFRVLSTWSLEVVLSWRSLSSDVRFFEEKAHSLSIAPEPLTIWNKKLEDLGFWLLKKLKISSEAIYPTALEHLSGFFLTVKNSDRGSLIVFLGSQLYVQGWWWLAVEMNSL
jgi:hypothetical protein